MENKNLKCFLMIILLLLNTGLLNAETITIAHHKDYYPFAFVDKNGESKGFLIDYWTLWGKKANKDIVLVPSDLSHGIEKIINLKADIVCGLFYHEKLEKYLEFADAILPVDTNLFLEKGKNFDSIEKIDVLIGTIQGSFSHVLLKNKYPGLNLKLYESFSSLKMDIINKNIKGFVYDFTRPFAKYKSFPVPAGYNKYQTLYSRKIRPAVKKNNIKMLNILISGSSNIYPEEVIEIAKKWQLFKEDNSFFWWSIVSTIFFFISILFLIFYIRRQKEKEKISPFGMQGKELEELIKKGETNFVEFKSTLRWDLKQKKINKMLEHVIAKSISAFLNTEGGFLFIGVDDSGTVLGLENDYSTMSKKNSDGFMLTLTNLINNHLGKNCHQSINITIMNIDQRDVCVVSITKSDVPVFVGKNGKEEFFIRTSCSSQPMGMKESLEYIKSQFK
ncbi:MAG: hypothetical protein DRH93_13540 [Deltaproteobacteria bacterium]|nr:MAG: hypothetical protein DRH93_13540 [Deltaproteobacteria bacterium]